MKGKCGCGGSKKEAPAKKEAPKKVAAKSKCCAGAGKK